MMPARSLSAPPNMSNMLLDRLDLFKGSIAYRSVRHADGAWKLDEDGARKEFEAFADLIDQWDRVVREHSEALGGAPDSNSAYVVQMPKAPNFHFDRGRRTIVLGIQNAPTIVARGAGKAEKFSEPHAEVPLGNDQTVPASLDYATFELRSEGEVVVLDGLDQTEAPPIAHSPPWASMFVDGGAQMKSIVFIANWA